MSERNERSAVGEEPVRCIVVRERCPQGAISRSQAKMLTAGIESGEVELDFSDVEWIGQGFAHELFVVFARKHPRVTLVPVHAGTDVKRMIYHVTH